MPIYEFICNKCQNKFEQFVLSIAGVKEVRCPSCGSENVTKQFSTFSCMSGMGGSFSSGGSFGSSGCSGSSGFS